MQEETPITRGLLPVDGFGQKEVPVTSSSKVGVRLGQKFLQRWLCREQSEPYERRTGANSLHGRLGGRKTETLRIKIHSIFNPFLLLTIYISHLLALHFIFSSTVAVLTGTGGTALARLSGPPMALDGFAGLRQLASGEDVRCHSSAGAATTANCCCDDLE